MKYEQVSSKEKGMVDYIMQSKTKTNKNHAILFVFEISQSS
jgi:hypothetical protein